jgi:hypothetical protein
METYAVIGTFIISGIVSISISAWQNKIEQGSKIYFNGHTWYDICNNIFPYQYLRREYYVYLL